MTNCSRQLQPTREQFLANSARWQQIRGNVAEHFGRHDREIAQRAVAGEIAFQHIGMQFTQVGRQNIDWSGGHHKHQEWCHQLNRCFELVALAEAYKATVDEQYPQAAADYIRDWIRAHPPRPDWCLAPYDEQLNLPIRVQCWLCALPELMTSPVFADSLVAEIFNSVTVQLDYLSGRLTTVGNWRIAEADALMLAGAVLDGAPGARTWRNLAVDVLNDAFHRQILPDGAHVERTPGYHDWMRRVFEGYWRLGLAMPELGLAMSVPAIARMHDYSLASYRPNGQRNGINDSSGATTGPRAKSWDEARRKFRAEAGLDQTMPPTSQFFPDAGQALLRDSWNEDATYITFDASNWGGGHSHLSRNGIQLHAHGRTLLVDPGTLTYEVSDPLMAHGKSTRAHNTVNLNGWNQSANNPKTRFATAAGSDLVASLYDGGYWPGRYEWHWPVGYGQGIWAQHYRLMLWVRGRFVLVLDDVLNMTLAGGKPTLELNWQFGPAQLEVDIAARRVVTTHADANLLLLTPLAPPAMTMTVHAGETNPPAGWLAGTDGYVPAPQLRFRSVAHEDWQTDLATVLVPFAGRAIPQVTATAKATGQDAPGCVTLNWGNGETDTVFWTQRMESAVGLTEGIATDGGLVHLHHRADRSLADALAVDATYLRPWTREIAPVPRMIVISDSQSREP